MKKIAVLTSGGDAPGMNAAIRAVVRYGIYNKCKVYGVNRGYKGLIEGDLTEMTLSSVGDIIHRGGTILRSARCEEFKSEEGRQKAANVLKVFGIDGLIVIGGDGTFTGARLMSEMGIPAVGIPGTIDNDLAYTDYTIGFDTALNTVLDAVTKVRDTSNSHDRVSILEVMGRNCGDIALYAGLAGGAEVIVVPEKEFSIDDVCKKLLQTKSRGKKHSIIMLAEGVGGAQKLSEIIFEKTQLECRATILGHIQRGGSPSAFDRILATKMGAAAVDLLLRNKFSRVIGIRGNKIVDLDINEALAMESSIDDEMLVLASKISI